MQMVSDSASFKNLLVLWAQDLQLTLLVFVNPFHTRAPSDTTPKMASPVTFFSIACSVLYWKSCLCPVSTSPLYPLQFITPDLLSETWFGEYTPQAIRSFWGREWNIRATATVSVTVSYEVDPENLESGQQFIFSYLLIFTQEGW